MLAFQALVTILDGELRKMIRLHLRPVLQLQVAFRKMFCLHCNIWQGVSPRGEIMDSVKYTRRNRKLKKGPDRFEGGVLVCCCPAFTRGARSRSLHVQCRVCVRVVPQLCQHFKAQARSHCPQSKTSVSYPRFLENRGS